jgi:penicillin-binding protein-related factor A (putative recombinase)
MTPEGRIKTRVKKVLATHGAYYHMPVQNGMGAPTLDFIGCHHGRYFAVETKALGKKPTPRQEVTIASITSTGGMCFVVSDDAELANLDAWLARVNQECNPANAHDKSQGD